MKYYNSYDDEPYETEIDRKKALERIKRNYNNAEEVLTETERKGGLIRMRGGYIRIQR